jgi:hypothetical protein
VPLEWQKTLAQCGPGNPTHYLPCHSEPLATARLRGENVSRNLQFRHAKPPYSNIPAIDAEIRFAIVPANIARIPKRASSPLLFGANAPMPPI